MNFHLCLGLGLGLIALASCHPPKESRRPVSNSAAPVLPAPRAPNAVKNDIHAGGAPRHDDRTSLPEPKGAVDPDSLEAAEGVIQHYGALIGQERFVDAASLWGDAASAADFARQLDHSQAHLEIGAPGEPEGAAGSIYTNVPVVFTGKGFRRRANIVLRRVNDVPGSTEAQRRWHIERIDWVTGS